MSRSIRRRRNRRTGRPRGALGRYREAEERVLSGDEREERWRVPASFVKTRQLCLNERKLQIVNNHFFFRASTNMARAFLLFSIRIVAVERYSVETATFVKIHNSHSHHGMRLVAAIFGDSSVRCQHL